MPDMHRPAAEAPAGMPALSGNLGPITGKRALMGQK